MNGGMENCYNIYTLAVYKDDEFNGFYGKPYAFMLPTEEQAKRVAMQVLQKHNDVRVEVTPCMFFPVYDA